MHTQQTMSYDKKKGEDSQVHCVCINSYRSLNVKAELSRSQS